MVIKMVTNNFFLLTCDFIINGVGRLKQHDIDFLVFMIFVLKIIDEP